MEFNRQKVTELARREIRAGKPKSDVFRDIYSLFNDPKLHDPIAQIVQYIPDPARIKKYGIINTVFMLLLAAICVAQILKSQYSALVVPLILLYLVSTRQTRYYQWITFVGGLLIIISLTTVITGWPEAQNNPLLTLGLAALTGVIFILFGIFMPRLLTPDYKTIEETTTNSDGHPVTHKKLIF
jgi:hypothetical protein